MPSKRSDRRPEWSGSTARIIASEGTHPTVTLVPPRVPWPTRATGAPASAGVIAAENPAEPAPITATS